MWDFLKDVSVLIFIAIVLFALFWFFLPEWMSRPLEKKEKVVKSMVPDGNGGWMEYDPMGVDYGTGEGVTAVTKFENGTFSPVSNEEYKKYLMGDSLDPRD